MRRVDKNVIYEDTALYLREIFYSERTSTKKGRSNNNNKDQPRRKSRRAEYSKVQSMWKKDRSSCIRHLLKDKQMTNTPAKEIMIPYWERIMSESSESTPGVEFSEVTLTELWSPVLPREVEIARPSLGTSPGPDGFSARFWRDVPVQVWVRIYNIFMFCGRLPQYLLESRTTLIPKKNNASEPGDFRPITVSSVISRTFHKILANRMASAIRLDPRQKGFRSTDGCSENIFLLDLILKVSRLSHRPLCMATLDVAKAFDSVTHSTIVDTLKSFGVPQCMTKYIADVYERSSTVLQCGNWISDAIHPKRGVKQGDPLSPIIFNMVVDRLFTKFPKEIGCRVGGHPINALGYADDLILFSTTPIGLQHLLDICGDYLHKCGLNVNAAKCATISFKNVPKEKKTVVDVKETFKCCNQLIPAHHPK